jgi:2-polyprenyl-3-methyl-5-hydroxy-6-metoxy-1,4-benzoquinol methylase
LTNTADYWDEVWRRELATPPEMSERNYRDKFAVVVQLCQGHRTVGDYGCGRGLLLQQLSQRGLTCCGFDQLVVCLANDLVEPVH